MNASVMLAVEYDAFGAADVLEVREVAEPNAPGAGEMRVRVRATSVNPKDTFVRKGRFVGVTGSVFPRRVGYDWAGTVAAVGPDVTGFAIGDDAYGMLDGWAGGACAESVVVKVAETAMAPRGLGATEAAAIPLAALTALQAFALSGESLAGRRVLVNGASGGVGSFALQIARAGGAHVTAISSAVNEARCRGLGANDFIDYGTTSILARPQTYDVIFDVFGALKFGECAARLSPTGVMVTTVPSPANLAAAALNAERGARRMVLVVVRPHATDLVTLATMVETGELVSTIDRAYPMADIRQAHEHVESKHTRGKVVVEVS